MFFFVSITRQLYSIIETKQDVSGPDEVIDWCLTQIFPPIKKDQLKLIPGKISGGNPPAVDVYGNKPISL
jgi:hypothetical protein